MSSDDLRNSGNELVYAPKHMNESEGAVLH